MMTTIRAKPEAVNNNQTSACISDPAQRLGSGGAPAGQAAVLVLTSERIASVLSGCLSGILSIVVKALDR
jgi:hypothetical protein